MPMIIMSSTSTRGTQSTSILREGHRVAVSARGGSRGEAPTVRSSHCQSLLGFHSPLWVEGRRWGGWGAGEPSKKAGSPKLHSSKPGGTFAGSEARLVEGEVRGTGLYLHPWGGPDHKPLPLLSGGPPSAHPGGTCQGHCTLGAFPWQIFPCSQACPSAISPAGLVLPAGLKAHHPSKPCPCPRGQPCCERWPGRNVGWRGRGSSLTLITPLW